MYFIVTAEMCQDERLDSRTKLLAYAMIKSFSQDGKSHYYGGQQYLADKTGSALRTVKRALQELEMAGMIKSEECAGKRTKYWAVIEDVADDTGAKMAPEGCQNGTTTSAKMAPLNEAPIYINNNKRDIKENTKRLSPFVSRLLELGATNVALCEDLEAQRKRKRAVSTENAAELIAKAASDCCISLDQAVAIAVERGWTTIRPDWLRRDREKSITEINREREQAWLASQNEPPLLGGY